jgi:hypothetical protein
VNSPCAPAVRLDTVERSGRVGSFGLKTPVWDSLSIPWDLLLIACPECKTYPYRIGFQVRSGSTTVNQGQRLR